MTKIPSQEILRAARKYSLYVCQERALPSVTDGFKSSQRIATWVLSKNSGKIKVAALSGAMIATGAYLHGNAEPTISKMAGPFINNIPIFKGTGNFGSRIAPGEFGAGRYTYVSESKFMRDVVLADSNLHHMVPSVDGDYEMCETFLPLIPLVLLNGVSGTAIGWSTDILPHKFEDLRDAVIRVLNGKEVGKIDPYFNAYPETQIVEVDNGRENASKYVFSGRVKKLNTNTVQITAIPPGLSMDSIQEHLDKLIEDRKIVDYSNNTTDVVDIEVKLTRKDLAELNEEQLITLFKLRTTSTERLVCVDFDGDKVRVFNNVDELITEWVQWRFGFIVKRFDALIYDNEEELNYQRALRHLFEIHFIEEISKFASKKQMRDFIVKEVQEQFDLRPSRIDRILDLAAYRWTIEYYDECRKTIRELEEERTRLKEIRSDDQKMRNEWINDLKKIKL